MNISEVKTYLEKTKEFKNLGKTALKTINDYLTNEFGKYLTANYSDENHLKIDWYRYIIIIDFEMNWSKEKPRVILNASHQFINNKNILENELIKKYYIDKNGFVYKKIDGEDGIGHVSGGTEKDFQITFTADLFSKIIETEKVSVFQPIQP